MVEVMRLWNIWLAENVRLFMPYGFLFLFNLLHIIHEEEERNFKTPVREWVFGLEPFIFSYTVFIWISASA